MPLIFKISDKLGVCPKIFARDPFILQCFRAKTWFDKGALGVTYMNAPVWLDEALSVMSMAENEASRFVMEMRSKERHGRR